MISKDQFLELKHLKSLGVPTTTIAKKIGISVPNANKWLRLDEEAFENYLRNNTPYLEQYRAFIISILKICPQTPATNIMYRIKDQFPDFNCKKTTFFKYVRDLREQTGYVKPSERPTSFREETPPGYEAQVDFGQFKMKDMYDRNIHVYFFCMVLSYSRMRFVYFSREPFRTKTAVDAHKYAFRYFGGRTQTILYDQDRLFVVSEKYGNIILVPEFEDFVRKAGFNVVLCHKSDPQTKGKVESFVRYVKEGFLQGRLYTGIDSLNSAALEWLDKECNGTTHDRTRKAPRELFREESKHLTKVQTEDTEVAIRAVSDKHAVIYDWSKYELPHSRVKQYDTIRIEENDGLLMFYKADTGELIHKCRKSAEEGGDVPYKDDAIDMETVGENAIRRVFDDVEDIESFIAMLREQNGRYANSQMNKIVSLARAYTADQVESAILYCIRVKKCSLNEVQAYLLYRYGLGMAKRKRRNRMADLIELYEKARLLNLQNLAHGKIDLDKEVLSNIDYLDYILSQELELRRQAAIKRHTNASRLPKREFDPARLKPGIAWQVEQLENMQWIDEGQNLVIIGKCDTGKTTLAAHIGQIALRKKEAVYYCNIEEFLRVIKNKDKSRRTEIIYRYILDCSVIIIDDVMYANIMPEDLPLFYRAVSFLNEDRSIIIITNRELSGWINAAEDTHLMQTLVDRITANSQIIRL